MTSLTHLIPIDTHIRAKDLAWIFIKEIVRLHGLADSIVSDCDPKFVAKFWKETHQLLSTKLLMSTSFHPQMDGTSKRKIHSLNQVLWSMVTPDQKNWVKCIPLTKFALNTSVSATTGYAPFELTYGFLPRMVTGIQPSNHNTPGVRSFAQNALRTVANVHDSIIESHIVQTYHANMRQRAELPSSVGSLVYISTENLSMPKGHACKLMPHYIGPYRVAIVHPKSSAYTVELPPDLAVQQLHPTFHVSKLCPHKANDADHFPGWDTQFFYDFGAPHENKWLISKIIGHRWADQKIEFEVCWNLGNTTWEPFIKVRGLTTLSTYLDLQGVETWHSLSQNP